MKELDDLRVGNYIQHIGDKFYCIVKKLGSQNLEIERFTDKAESYAVSAFTPIKLTRENLPLAGFTQFDGGFKKLLKGGLSLAMNYNENGVLNLLCEDAIPFELRYVHQLQNAYFDITNEYLEINLFGV